MIPGMNPRKMQAAMRKLGISQVEIDASEVIIKCPDKEIIIRNPQVSKVNMMGQKTFQIIGQEEERSLSNEVEINEDDIRTVMEQAGVSKEKAEEKLNEKKGDLAEAILALKDSTS